MNEKYLHIDSASLAEDQDFISWVKYESRASDWSEWLNEYPDQKAKVNQARQLVSVLQFDTEKLPINKDQLWSRIDESTSGAVVELEKSTRTINRYYIGSILAIAASFILLFAIMPLLRQSNTITVAPGESITHVLPDNSKVYINADSKIIYDKRDFASDREIELIGEAFFEVEKGSNFKVVTNNGTIQVLGTKFNVFSRDESFEVKCTEGRVQVSSKKGKGKEILQAGDIVRLSTSKELERIPFKAKFDWRKDAYTYNIVPLAQVFDEIERQFNVEIIASPQIESMSFTGPLETKNLDKALYMVTWPMSLNYKVTGKTIEIERNQ